MCVCVCVCVCVCACVRVCVVRIGVWECMSMEVKGLRAAIVADGGQP